MNSSTETSLLDKKELKSRLCAKLYCHFGILPEKATLEQFYRSSVMVVQELLNDRRRKYEEQVNREEAKTVYYMCMEFLIGRSLKNNLYNLGIMKQFEEAVSEMGVPLQTIFDKEPDAGLGNGGLGRLAVCFLDSAASLGYPINGYSIRYEFGIFKQKIIDGWQTELPDLWLNGGDAWLSPRVDEAVTVKFDGEIIEEWKEGQHSIEHKNYNGVLAIPYDMMISGYENTSVSVLRLWGATSMSLDMELFNQGHYMHAIEQKAMAEVVSKVLYPSDNHLEGKSLRLRQQYFLVSSSVQDIIRKHIMQYGTIDNFADKVVIHINETHPALAIPEIMRILLDEYAYSWEKAWDVIQKTIAYTNHTIMSEALEIWPEELFRERLPRIYQLVVEINNRFCKEVFEKTNGDSNKVSDMSIINFGQIRMANLCLSACYSVNGVSQIHSNIIKNSLFHNFSEMYPEKFNNVTNGFAYRRWICQANPLLCEFITDLIGNDFTTKPNELGKLLYYVEDKSVLNKIVEIKRQNKVNLAKYIKNTTGISVDTSSIFDVQAKRLHEYKRQLLNALHILHLYDQLKQNPNMDFYPHTYIFAAKAAPGYYMAKQIIRLINCMANVINNDASIQNKIKIVFLEDYKVTLAELLMPAAEISEQISLAGTEASGTGNMKLMVNGAITLGTMDGANIEISEAVGEDNILIFGLRNDEVIDLKTNGYFPSSYYKNNRIRNVIDRLKSGIDGISFEDIATSLIGGQQWMGDPYMVLADFDSYCDIHEEAALRYSNLYRWNKMSLINIASAGELAADRAVMEYAQKIWKINKVIV